MEMSSKHPYGSTGSLQNIRNQAMGPNSLPVAIKVNRPQSADQSASRFAQQGHQIAHGSRPTSQQTMKVENSIPLPKRNTLHTSVDQSATKIQRNSLTSQHFMASKKPQHQQTQQILQHVPNNTPSMQAQTLANHQQQHQRIN